MQGSLDTQVGVVSSPPKPESLPDIRDQGREAELVQRAGKL